MANFLADLSVNVLLCGGIGNGAQAALTEAEIEICSGVEGDAYTIVPNRTEAIRTAISMATHGDTVLLAGKGHETWQIFSDRVIQYDEREIAREILKEEGY